MKNLELQSLVIPIPECSRCGKRHEQVLAKPLLNPFIISGHDLFKHYQYHVVYTTTNGEEIKEPRLLLEENIKEFSGDGEIFEFKKPMVIDLPDNYERHYQYWSYCENAKEPFFLAIEIQVEKAENNETKE